MFYNSFKVAKPRRFEYNFRYYKPPDEEEKRIKFRRIRKSEVNKKNSVLRLAILLVILSLTILYLEKRNAPHSRKADPTTKTFKVEEVIVVD
jgi:hypothetical protein